MTPPDAAAAGQPQSSDWKIRLIETFAPAVKKGGLGLLAGLIIAVGAAAVVYFGFDVFRTTTNDFKTEVKSCHTEACGKLDKIADELRQSNAFMRRLLIKRGEDPDDGVIGTAGPQ